MDGAVLVKLEKILAAGIDLVPELNIPNHYVFARDGFAAFVEKRKGEFGNIGSPGLVTEKGFAPLLWRGDQAVFVGRGFEVFASAQQVESIRAFDRDLNEALR